MPRIISFAWTSPALLAGEKSVTRRDWAQGYAHTWTKGQPAMAYDRSPRVGGKHIADIVLTDNVLYLPDADCPDADYEDEGFRYIEDHLDEAASAGGMRRSAIPYLAFDVSWAGFCRWRNAGGFHWVIRFDLVRVVAHADSTAKEALPR